MTPYYEHSGITIYHGDCRFFARGFDVDAVITDPPYGETSLEWDRRVEGWVFEMELCCSLMGSMWVFGSLRSFFGARSEFGDWKLAQDIVWEKQNGSGFHADRFKRVHEMATQWYRAEWENIYKLPVMTHGHERKKTSRKSQPPHTGGIQGSDYDSTSRLMRSVMYAPNCHGFADHPTQKPIEIIDPLLRYSVPPGGIVMDPFMGSGSTLVAAKRLGMRAIGIEIEEAHCESAAKRLSQEVIQFTEAVHG